MPQSAVPVMEDSTNGIQAFVSPKPTRASRHYDIKLFLGRDYVERHLMVMVHVNTGLQLADTGTKALPMNTFEAMDDALMGRGNEKLLHLQKLNLDTKPGSRRSTEADEYAPDGMAVESRARVQVRRAAVDQN